jgi:hypothetical protein
MSQALWGLLDGIDDAPERDVITFDIDEENRIVISSWRGLARNQAASWC